MCARHDIQIGRYCVEVEPTELEPPGSLMLYLRVVDQADGDVTWQGCVRFNGTALWEAECYGGRPYSFESHTPEVQSD